jgi:hypothetical protein
VKHTFLLDENVIVLAAKREDDHGNRDSTCSDLVLLIAQNCHRILANDQLYARYWRKIKALSQDRRYAVPELVGLVAQLIKNPDKIVVEAGDLPNLPEGTAVQEDDHVIVRSALRSGAPIVTTDPGLRQAVNECTELATRGITPVEALKIAQDQ